MLHRIAILLVFFLTAGTVAVQAQIRFSPSRCDFLLPARVTIDCGYIQVPENYDNPQGTQIQLSVAILRHPGGAPESDPIIYLEGGPGGSALGLLHLTYALRYKPIFAANRDIIVFDQRGIGSSTPALDCDNYQALWLDLLDLEYDEADLTRQAADQMLVDTLVSCLLQLSTQHDLSQYNSATSARDIEMLRTALGYDQVNLWGISYGTRLALTMMRDYPNHIRSAVLDSVYPLDVNLFTDSPYSWTRALGRLFDACAENTACSQSYPDLRSAFFETVNKLKDKPVRLSAFNPLTGTQYHHIVLDDILFYDLTLQFLYDSNVIPALPQIIYSAYHDNYDAYGFMIGRIIAQQTIISDGTYVAVQCQEEVPFMRRGDMLKAYQANPELYSYLQSGQNVERILDVCDAVPAGTSAAIENSPVFSAIPTLLTGGYFDPVTPPEWGRQVHEQLPNSTFVEFPDSGHGRTGSPGCPQRTIIAFFVDPLSEPDTSCAADMKLDFIVNDLIPGDSTPVIMAPARFTHRRFYAGTYTQLYG